VCKHQSHAAGALGATLLDPARIAASLANADGAALQTFAGQLLDGRDGSGMSLLTPASKMRAMLEPMLASKRPVLRAMAVFAYGFHRDEAGLAVCRKALAEKDPWIRRAAVLGLGQAPMTLEEREELLGPSLRDPDDVVVRAAAIALLTPELRRTAGLQYEFRRFSYVKALQIYGSISWSSDGRAPAVIARRPTFLTDLRKLSARGGAPDKNGKDMAPILALLLAQYGDFAAFHAYARTALKSNTLLPPTVAGIALSRDPQYLPPLEAWFGKSRDNSAPRALLKSIRGTEGDAARKLRREANRRLRQQANF